MYALYIGKVMDIECAYSRNVIVEKSNEKNHINNVAVHYLCFAAYSDLERPSFEMFSITFLQRKVRRKSADS